MGRHWQPSWEWSIRAWLAPAGPTLEAALRSSSRPVLPAMRSTIAICATVAMLGGCTPLGMWVYEDPSFALQSVTLRSGPDSGAGADSMDLVFAGCNRNDYEVVGESLLTSLHVDGHKVAQGRRDQPYRIATRDSAPVMVTLAMQGDWIYGTTALPVELESEVLLKLPNGERRYVLSQKGTLVMKEGKPVLKVAEGRRCRPGSSVLPGQFSRPVDMERPEPIRPVPNAPGPGNQP